MDTLPLSILLVEDDPLLTGYLGRQLRLLGHTVHEASNAEQGWQMYMDRKPQVILLDVMLPDHDGLSLARRIRAEEGAHWTHIVFISALAQEADLVKGIEAGGDDYLFKPVSGTVLQAKLHAACRHIQARDALNNVTQALAEANDRLRHQSLHDELTGLGNRRGFDERLKQYLGQARRDQRPLTLLMCDVDYFKNYNDALGHPEGDACLRRIGQVLNRICRRPMDYAARYGGEEFALLLPNTPADGALTFAMALQHALDVEGLPHPASTVADHVTLSGGFISLVPEGHISSAEMIREADEALYQAKARGRYRFISLTPALDTAEQSVPAQDASAKGGAQAVGRPQYLLSSKVA
jgi:diguanylate cyclase (GGDEF)-like protein